MDMAFVTLNIRTLYISVMLNSLTIEMKYGRDPEGIQEVRNLESGNDILFNEECNFDEIGYFIGE